MSQYLFLVLLLLACPLMMIFMMRGHGHGASHGHRDSAGHAGHAGCGHGGHNGRAKNEPVSVDELRRQRDELDREIADRESYGTSSGDRSASRV